MKNLARVVCLGAALTIASSPRLFAQAIPAFDVTSITPSAPGTGNNIPGMVLPQPDGSVRAVNATMRDLVAYAFDAEPDRIAGASGWQLTSRFNVDARPSAGAAASNSLTRERMQSLLRERFKLRAHTESRETNVSALVLANRDGRLGPNLKPTTADCAAEPGACRTFVGPAGGRYTPGTPLQMSIRGVGVPLSLLAKTVGQAIGAMVVDRTGLNGLYDFETELAMDPQLAMRQIAQTGAALPPGALQPGDSPAMSTLLQERLGLKLETQRAPITFVVIDSAEPPSAN
jgi:uncharacterized protein (TIGR03435 family)